MSPLPVIFLLVHCRSADPEGPIDDVLVSDPAHDIRDPEFDPLTKRIAFTDRGQLWVTDLDPATGAMVDPTGRQTWVDAAVVTRIGSAGVGNGPEWGQSARGSSLYYTRRVGGRHHVAAAHLASEGWTTTSVAADGWLPIPALAAAAAEPRFAYMKGVRRVRSLGWSAGAGSAGTIPIAPLLTLGPPRWVGDRHQLTAVVRGPGGHPNAVLVDLDAHEVIPIPHPRDRHTQIHDLWAVPFGAGQTLVWFVQTTLSGDTLIHDAIHVLRYTSDGWSEVGVRRPAVPLDAQRPFLQSPEPFWSEGRPFVAVLLSGSPRPIAAPADLWILDLSDDGSPGRRISENTVRVRREPEPLTLGGRVSVYYTELVDDIATLRRAATGLSSADP